VSRIEAIPAAEPSVEAAKPPRDRWLGLIAPLAILALWELAGRAGQLPRYLVPPSAILSSWWEMASDGELLLHIGSSMFRQSFGFAIGATFGVMIGLLPACSSRWSASTSR
jgi:sulfonate transport system permease protein